MKLHIVSLNVPYPPNYGGVIDIFYKIKALHEIGIDIILHCFDYGRGKQTELEKYCKQVHYYPRKKSLLKQFSPIPFIVKSRNSKELLNNLLTHDYPILFEGLHSTYHITNSRLKDRVKVVRTHNIEHDYYKMLKLQETFLPRKLFFNSESKKLKKYEQVLEYASLIAAISPNDAQYFQQQYGNTIWLPPFHSNTSFKSETGLGNYALYHGNLSVPENIEAVQFIIKTYKNSTIPITISGKNPSESLKKQLLSEPNLKLVENPSFNEMIELIKQAQLLLLPTFQPTGIKLKLIESLFIGRHIIANNDMIKGTGLEKLCHIANSSQGFITKTQALLDVPFENKDLVVRKEVLGKHFTNTKNAEMLKNAIVSKE